MRRAYSRRYLLRTAVGFGILAATPACRGQSATPTLRPAQPTATPSAPVVVSAVAGYDKPDVWKGRTLVATSWGGDYQDAQQQAIFEPFQRLTGASIDVEATDLVELRKQVEDGDPTWDVCDVLADDVLSLANVGVLEELDFNVIDLENVFDDLKSDFGVASSFYSTILAINTESWPGGAAPSTWADFWDTTRYPGLRGLRRDPRTSMEFALLADGVARDALYPLDVERAFDSLERIRPAVSLWWEQGAQPAQSLNGGGLAAVSAWHNRILKTQGEGAPVDLNWNNGALSGDVWVVPKGSKNRDVAMDLINFATRPETSAAFASLAPFGPVNKKAFDFLPATAANIPTSPTLKPLQFSVNLEWWFKHGDQIDRRFEDWFAVHP